MAKRKPSESEMDRVAAVMAEKIKRGDIPDIDSAELDRELKNMGYAPEYRTTVRYLIGNYLY